MRSWKICLHLKEPMYRMRSELLRPLRIKPDRSIVAMMKINQMDNLDKVWDDVQVSTKLQLRCLHLQILLQMRQLHLQCNRRNPVALPIGAALYKIAQVVPIAQIVACATKDSRQIPPKIRFDSMQDRFLVSRIQLQLRQWQGKLAEMIKKRVRCRILSVQEWMLKINLDHHRLVLQRNGRLLPCLDSSEVTLSRSMLVRTLLQACSASCWDKMHRLQPVRVMQQEKGNQIIIVIQLRPEVEWGRDPPRSVLEAVM